MYATINATVKKLTVRTVKAPWIDEELKNRMVERDGAKGVANKSGCTSDWLTYSKLRISVTKLNKKKAVIVNKNLNLFLTDIPC